MHKKLAGNTAHHDVLGPGLGLRSTIQCYSAHARGRAPSGSEDKPTDTVAKPETQPSITVKKKRWKFMGINLAREEEASPKGQQEEESEEEAYSSTCTAVTRRGERDRNPE